MDVCSTAGFSRCSGITFQRETEPRGIRERVITKKSSLKTFQKSLNLNQSKRDTDFIGRTITIPGQCLETAIPYLVAAKVER